MTAVPIHVLDALDMLNGHARAFGSGSRAIYAYKTLAALNLAEAGDLAARPVFVDAPCRSCDGSGLFRHYDHHQNESVVRHENWRTCKRTGKVRLLFTETTFFGYCWHHPISSGGSEILRAAWRFLIDQPMIIDGSQLDATPQPVGDWMPNRPAEQLTHRVALLLLNLVEEWLIALPETYEVRAVLRQMRGYSLRLDRHPRDPEATLCCLCGQPVGEDSTAIGMLAYKLDWSEACCALCRAEQPFKFPKGPPPAHLITPPLRRWLARREIDIEQPWTAETARAYHGELPW